MKNHLLRATGAALLMVLLGASRPAAASHVSDFFFSEPVVNEVTRHVDFEYFQFLTGLTDETHFSNLIVNYGDGTSDTFGPLAFLPAATEPVPTFFPNGSNVFFPGDPAFNDVIFNHTYANPGTYTVTWRDQRPDGVIETVDGRIASGSFVIVLPGDNLPPTTTASVSGTPGENGWLIRDAAVNFTATDNTDGSGVKEIHFSVDGGAEQVVAGAAASVPLGDGTHSVQYFAVDNAGNMEASKTLDNVMVDGTGPVITIANTGPFVLGAGGRPTFTAVDAVSGVNPDRSSDSVTHVSVGPSGAGTYRYTAFAFDFAGNMSEKSVEFRVEYVFHGFLAPLESRDVFKKGSTIPVKFQLFDANGNPVPNAEVTFANVLVNVNPETGEADEGTTESPTNSFRYDAGSQQYIMNWSTKKPYPLPVGQHKLTVVLDDGTKHEKIISLR